MPQPELGLNEAQTYNSDNNKDHHIPFGSPFQVLPGEQVKRSGYGYKQLTDSGTIHYGVDLDVYNQSGKSATRPVTEVSTINGVVTQAGYTALTGYFVKAYNENPDDPISIFIDHCATQPLVTAEQHIDYQQPP